jgi:hypothetical protein
VDGVTTQSEVLVQAPEERPWRALALPWSGALVALVAVAAVGFDRMVYVWTANAPWVGPTFRSIVVSPSVGALALLVVWGWLAGPAEVSRWEPTGARIAVGAGAVLLVTTALSIAVALVMLLSVARLGEIAFGLLACWTIAHRPRLARWLVVSFGALVLVELPLVLLQEATQSTFPYLTLLYGLPNELPTSAAGAAVVITSSGARWQRAQGMFPHPNVLGGFLAVTLVLGLVWLGRRERPPWPVLAVWLIGWLELFLTFSRAALLAAILGSVTYGLSLLRLPHARRTIAGLLGAAVVAGLVAVMLAGPVVPRWMAVRPSLLDSPSAVQRELIAGIALAMIRSHPLLGVGAGNFSLATLLPPYDAVTVDPAHAVPLLVAAESGVLAGLAWFALVLAAPIGARRRHDLSRFWGQAAVIVALLTLSMLDHYLWTLTAGRAVFWTALGIAMAYPGDEEVAT